MRRFGRTDRNQAEIVKALRKLGATVECLSAVGGGCIDLLVGFKGINYCLEVKDWMAAPADQALTPDQKEWHKTWQGQKAVVKTVEEALREIL